MQYRWADTKQSAHTCASVRTCDELCDGEVKELYRFCEFPSETNKEVF